ncbi:MAG: gliding motility-associated C-terminal domain-containing protein [Sphingobacteriales bacterium]
MRGLKLLFVLILLTGLKCLGQAPNIGFEDGNFGNWECSTGLVDTAGNVNVTVSGPVPGRHTIIGKGSANALDPYGKFPVLCPNGSKYSVRLGGPVIGRLVERISYTLTVPQGLPYSIVLNYAVVLENPNHKPYEQPRFTAKVYDLSDDKYIDCPAFDFVASSSLPGFKPGLNDVTYKDWASATIDLTAFSGKTVQLEFTAIDCSRGGHFGYAYLDINDNIGSPVTGNAYCIGQSSVKLTAPYGFAGYDWYDANHVLQKSDGRDLTISPPPPDGSKYSVVIFPYDGLGCIDTLYTTVNKIDEGFKLKVLDTVSGCPGIGADLTAASVTAGSSGGMTYAYYKDSLQVSYLPNPNKVVVPGTYYIQGTNTEGCMNILPVVVDLTLPVINVVNPRPVSYPSPVDLSKTFMQYPKLTYSYYSDAAATIPVENFTAIVSSGTYYIKAENKTGCDTIAPVKVVINPPSYTITAPNTFTPNNDGVNDLFNVSIIGAIRFDYLKIYSRYGQIVFSSTSPEQNWDGKVNGKLIDEGTYYWIFEGANDYYHSKITRSGSITLLR